MTTPSILEQLRAEWRTLGRSTASHASAILFCERHPDLKLTGVDDLVDLVSVLDQQSPLTTIERAAVIQALLLDARDPELRRALFQTMLPGITSVCSSLRYGKDVFSSATDFLVEALAMFHELILQWAGENRAYAGPDLLNALRNRLGRFIANERDVQYRTSTSIEDHHRPMEQCALRTLLESYLGSEHDHLARLTYQSVIGGYPLTEIARREGKRPDLLQRELRRWAEQYLT